MDFSVGEWKIVTQSEVQGQMRRDLVSILRISIQSVAADAARKISAALQEEDRGAKQEAGKGVRDYRKGSEDKETIGGNSLQHIDLKALVSAAEFEFVIATGPADVSGRVKGVLVTVARASDWIAHRGVSVDLNEGRTDRHFETGIVFKA